MGDFDGYEGEMAVEVPKTNTRQKVKEKFPKSELQETKGKKNIYQKYPFLLGLRSRKLTCSRLTTMSYELFPNVKPIPSAEIQLNLDRMKREINSFGSQANPSFEVTFSPRDMVITQQARKGTFNLVTIYVSWKIKIECKMEESQRFNQFLDEIIETYFESYINQYNLDHFSQEDHQLIRTPFEDQTISSVEIIEC